MINHIEFSNSANKVGNYKESLWWSFNAIVTGGFADIYNPTTSGENGTNNVACICWNDTDKCFYCDIDFNDGWR